VGTGGLSFLVIVRGIVLCSDYDRMHMSTIQWSKPSTFGAMRIDTRYMQFPSRGRRSSHPFCRARRRSVSSSAGVSDVVELSSS
jgi:hypothetical protein